MIRRLLATYVVLASLVAATLVIAPGAHAADLNQARERALREYGWRPEAIAYMVGHTRLIESSAAAEGNPCPAAVSCSLRDGTIYLNQVPNDPSVLDYVLNHEYIHAMDFARGSTQASIGGILADLLSLNDDTDHPVAAYAARRVLGLTARDDQPLVRTQDWFHLDHFLLEDVGWDVANLPTWYRDSHFPYLSPGAPKRVDVGLAPAPQPPDVDRRTHLVVDAMTKLCGPTPPSPPCSTDPPPVWANVPYPPLSPSSSSL